MSAAGELWDAMLAAMKANAALVEMVDGIHDKAPAEPFKSKQAYISRGPFYGSPEDADCIIGQEITSQIDIWSRKTSRWAMDDMISEVRRSLHEKELPLSTAALATIQVRLWRNTDDPDQTQQHGIVQVLAVIEEAEDA